MPLPEDALKLLAVLEADHERVIACSVGLDAALAASDMLSLEPVQAALARAAEREQQLPGSQRSLLRTLTGLAVIRCTHS